MSFLRNCKAKYFLGSFQLICFYMCECEDGQWNWNVVRFVGEKEINHLIGVGNFQMTRSQDQQFASTIIFAKVRICSNAHFHG